MKKCLLLLSVLCAFTVMAALTACPKTPPPATTAAPPASAAPSSAPVEQPLSVAPEKAVAPEKNPPGDIPDTQVFITYKPPSNLYSIKAPEGWARTESGAIVKFVDKFDGEQIVIDKATAAPVVESIKKEQVPALEKAGRAVKVSNVQSKKMPGGLTAICVVYTSNSEPDPVTSKQVRLDNETYYFYSGGEIASLTLWAPMGADNVDQWKLISESFKWQ
jgi:hypothetical protein